MKKTYKAIILNDYEQTPYATWFKEGKKTIETRMKRLFKYRGDIIICCGKKNSVGPNAGKALCMVNIYDGGPMQPHDEASACINWHPERKALYTNNLRHFSRDFEFAAQYVSGPFQGIFEITLPDDVFIIEQVGLTGNKPFDLPPVPNTVSELVSDRLARFFFYDFLAQRNLLWAMERTEVVLKCLIEFADKKPIPDESVISTLTVENIEGNLLNFILPYVASYKISTQTAKDDLLCVRQLYQILKTEYKSRVTEHRYREHVNFCIEFYNHCIGRSNNSDDIKKVFDSLDYNSDLPDILDSDLNRKKHHTTIDEMAEAQEVLVRHTTEAKVSYTESEKKIIIEAMLAYRAQKYVPDPLLGKITDETMFTLVAFLTIQYLLSVNISQEDNLREQMQNIGPLFLLIKEDFRCRVPQPIYKTHMADCLEGYKLVSSKEIAGDVISGIEEILTDLKDKTIEPI